MIYSDLKNKKKKKKHTCGIDKLYQLLLLVIIITMINHWCTVLIKTTKISSPLLLLAISTITAQKKILMAICLVYVWMIIIIHILLCISYFSWNKAKNNYCLQSFFFFLVSLIIIYWHQLHQSTFLAYIYKLNISSRLIFFFFFFFPTRPPWTRTTSLDQSMLHQISQKKKRILFVCLDLWVTNQLCDRKC